MHFSFVFHSNSQRPGAVLNMTCQEAAEIEYHDVKGEEFAVVKVADHKTSTTYGEAKLIMDGEVVTWFREFRDVLRPQRGSFGSSDPLFVTINGGKVTNLSQDVSTLAGELSEKRILNPTAARKATATMTASVANDVQRRLIANQMGHSSKTADMYYTSLGEDTQRIEAYRAMGQLRKKRVIDSDDEDSEPEIVQKKKRTKFTEEEERALKEFFNESRKASLEKARQFLEIHPDIKRTAKQIQDKVKQLLF